MIAIENDFKLTPLSAWGKPYAPPDSTPGVDTTSTPFDQVQRMDAATFEIARAARVLKDVTSCDKLNVAALGNTVRQLHVHVIARRQGDPTGAGPVWGAVPARPYASAERERLAGVLRDALGLT